MMLNGLIVNEDSFDKKAESTRSWNLPGILLELHSGRAMVEYYLPVPISMNHQNSSDTHLGPKRIKINYLSILRQVLVKT